MSTPPRSFHVRVGASDAPSFLCGSDETLLAAALKAGLGFPYECQSGSCGSCRFQLVEGLVHDLWPQAPGLTSEARELGMHLGCQCVPRSECLIRLRLKPDYVAPVTPTRMSAALSKVIQLTHDMAEFRFRSDTPARFLPGQYALLRLPGVDGARAYSMSNLANDAGDWHFIVKRKPGGAATAVLFDVLRCGDTIELEAPYGRSYLRTDTGRNIVCIGGGSGLSPMLAILRGAVSNPSLCGRRLLMFYGGRTPKDHCVPEIFSREPALAQRVELFSAISSPVELTDDWQGERGFIHEILARHLDSDPTQWDYYFCGPPPMTDAVHKLLVLDWRVPTRQLHFDRFV